MPTVTSLDLQPLLRLTIDFCNESINRGDFTSALQAMGRGLQLAPRDAQLHSQRGQLRLFLNDHEKALADFKCALEADHNLSPSHLGIARCQLAMGHPQQAREAVQRAKAIEPWSPEVEELLTELKAGPADLPAEKSSPPILPTRTGAAAPDQCSESEERGRLARRGLEEMAGGGRADG